MDPHTTQTYTLWGNIGGWLLAFFLGKKALSDRDDRMDDLGDWQKNHEKNHPNLAEALRMHAESRELMKHILDVLQANNIEREKSFQHLNDRIDKLVDRKGSA